MNYDNTWVRLPSGKKVNHDWFNQTDRGELYQRLLRTALELGGAADCECRRESLPVAIRKHDGKLHLARYPLSGPRHAPTCTFFAPPTETSGIRAYDRDVMVEHGDRFSIRLTHPLNGSAAENGGHAIERWRGGRTSGIESASVQGLVHLLWELSGSNLYRARVGEMSWYGHATRLMHASKRVGSGRVRLEDRFIAMPPKPGRLDLDRAGMVADCVGQRIVVVGEFGGFYDRSAPPGLLIRGFVKLPVKIWFSIERAKCAALERSYELECRAFDQGCPLGPVIVGVAATVRANRSRSGFDCRVDDAMLMSVSPSFVPCESRYEHEVAARMEANRRQFIKPMRYDAAARLAIPSFVSLDARDGRPVAMHVYERNDPESRAVHSACEALASQHYGRAWSWDISDRGGLPVLPST